MVDTHFKVYFILCLKLKWILSKLHNNEKFLLVMVWWPNYSCILGAVRATAETNCCCTRRFRCRCQIRSGSYPEHTSKCWITFTTNRKVSKCIHLRVAIFVPKDASPSSNPFCNHFYSRIRDKGVCLFIEGKYCLSFSLSTTQFDNNSCIFSASSTRVRTKCSTKGSNAGPRCGCNTAER